MADLDLKDALSMFTEGAKQLQLSRSIQSANEQVQQIKTQEADGANQLAQIRQVANNLTMHMAGMGIPATTMGAVSGALAPPHFANANEAYAYGVENNSEAAKQQGKTLQQFQFDLADKMALAESKRNPLMQQMAEEKRKEFNIRSFKDFSKDTDASAASSRSAFGVAGITGQRADRLTALIGSPENIKKANSTEMTLLAEGLANLVKNGVATESELKALVPNTVGSKKSEILQALINKPVSTNAQDFIEKYQGIIGREKGQSDKYVMNTILRRASGNMKLYERDPEQFRLTIAESIRSATGQDVNPEDVKVTKGKRVQIDNLGIQQRSILNTPPPVDNIVMKIIDGRPRKVRVLPNGQGEVLPE